MKKRLDVRYRCSGVACCYYCQNLFASWRDDGCVPIFGLCTSLATSSRYQAGGAMSAAAGRALDLSCVDLAAEVSLFALPWSRRLRHESTN